MTGQRENAPCEKKTISSTNSWKKISFHWRASLEVWGFTKRLHRSISPRRFTKGHQKQVLAKNLAQSLHRGVAQKKRSRLQKKSTSILCSKKSVHSDYFFTTSTEPEATNYHNIAIYASIKKWKGCFITNWNYTV